MSQVSPSAATTAATLPVAQVNAERFDQAALGIKPLPLENLVSGVPVPLDIYLPGVNEQDHTVVPSRIIAAGQDPTDAHLDLIRRSGFAHVFFRRRDQDLVLDYLAKRGRDLVGDAQVPAVDKARLLYDNAMYLVEAALTLPHMTENVRRGQEYIETVVQFVSGTPDAAAALVGLLEVDYTWFNHSVNVCLLSVSFGHFLGLSHDDIVTLGLGTLLHDIGKREVPEEILVKPGPLSESECEIMRQHPVTGAWTLANIGQIPSPAVRVVRHHHENLDGSGYPDGLTEVWLEPSLRIIRIIDSYDAVTSNRCYQPAQSAFHGLQVMKREMEGKLSAELFQSFIAFLGHVNPRNKSVRRPATDGLPPMRVLAAKQTFH